MPNLNHVSYEIGDRSLFQNLNLSLGRKRYGLVGPNGVGKSTLAKIIAGILPPSEGQVRSEGPVFYLAQSEPRAARTVAEELAELWTEPEAQGSAVLRLLEGIDENLELTALSGGEWMRLRLAKALMQAPAFLILDEPTNDLDADARKIVYEFLEQIDCGVLLISHDREALEIMDEILELSNQGLGVYGASFSEYDEIREQERERQENDLRDKKNQARKRRREREEKVQRQEKRMRAGAARADSLGLPRILLGGRKRRAQKTMSEIHVREEAFVENANRAERDTRENMKLDPFLRLDFESAIPAASKIHFSATDLNLRWPGTFDPLWPEKVSFYIKGSERWRIEGGNGVGKTTLLKLLLGTKVPIEITGEIFRSNSKIASLDQNYGSLDPELSVIDNLQPGSRFEPIALRNELAFYGFTGSLPLRKVKTLSGGETLKASLAKAFLGKDLPEVIFLDEPTNNLDLQSLELLEEALKKFRGALILISHDSVFAKNVNVTNSLVLRSLKKETTGNSG